jgi:hypothetical protein
MLGATIVDLPAVVNPLASEDFATARDLLAAEG